MAVKAQSTITLTRTDDGKTSYVHTVYLMPDGTFTKVLPGENLFSYKDTTNLNFDNNGSLTTAVWASQFKDPAQFKAMGLEAGKTYSIQYDFELLSLTVDTTVYNQGQHGTLLLYSGVAGYPNITLGGKYNGVDNVTDARTWTVGTKRRRQETFTLPTNVYDEAAKYKILFYTMRRIKSDGTTAVVENGKFSNIKLELGSTATPYTPSPQDDPVNAYPAKEGTYSDFNVEGSDNPDDYVWKPFRGVPGRDGIAGKDGVGITSTTITYAGSTSGITAPTSGWTATIPTVAAGQYLWTKTVWTYSDNTNETGYSVAKMGDTGAKGDKGDKGETGPQGPAGPKGDQGIMGVAYAQPTAPTTTQAGATWFKTKSATDNSVIGIYTLIGTTWTETPVTADALAVTSLSALSANLGKVTAGELDGVKIVGAEFSNPYSFTDVDQNQFDGTLTIKDSTVTNVGTINKGSTTDAHNYKTVDSPITKVAQMFKGADQTTLEQSYELTTNGLYLRQGSVSGLLTVDMLYDSGWVPLTVTNGTGKVYIRKYMKRWMLRFDNYSYNGTAQVTTIPESYNPKTSQMLNVVIWTADPDKPSEKFQLNADGGLHKVTNVSTGTAFTTYAEIYSAAI